jgi:hypothetical protein
MDCAPLLNYLQIVWKEFTDLRTVNPACSLDAPEFRSLFLSTVNALEKSPEFISLSKCTLQEFNKDKSFAGIWQHHITTFFRWSGLYEKIFERENLSREEICSLYERELKAESGQWTYFAPVELLQFPEQPLTFGNFTIRSFTAEELNTLLRQRTCKLFYPWAVVDLYRLSQFWMIVCTEEKPIHAGLTLWADQIRPKYSPFSGKLKNAFRILSLYKWRAPYQTDENMLLSADTQGIQSLNVYPSLPFTIQIPQGCLQNPPAAPDLSELPMEPIIDNDGEEVGEHPYFAFDISGNENEFREFVRNTDALIEKIRRVPHWQFMDVALSFMEKAFTDHGLEQLLWNITAVEALMGEQGSGLTNRLMKRVSYILGNNDAEIAQIKRVFQKLYDLRSQFIHGNVKLLDPKVVHYDLAQAREMARQTALWMLAYLNHVLSECEKIKTELPSRENLLAVLNLDKKSRTQTANILTCLPNSFPRVPSWEMDRARP